jgi:hypothetical protein
MAKKSPHEVIYTRAAPEVAEALKLLADEENRSVSNMVETILRRYLEDVGKLPKELALTNLTADRASEATEASVPALVSASIALFGFLLMWIAGTFLWKPSGPEAPEVTQAKISAQLAEIQRQQSNSIWWQGAVQLVFGTLWLAGVAVICTVLGVVWYKMYTHRRQVEMEYAYRVKVVPPNEGGTYPLVWDELEQRYVRYEPGNPPNFNQSIAMLPAGNQRPAKRTLRMNGRDVPFELAAGDYDEAPISDLFASNPKTVETISAETETNSETAKRKKLADLKSRGVGKSKAIQAVTLAKPGDNAEWRKWSARWDSL